MRPQAAHPQSRAGCWRSRGADSLRAAPIDVQGLLGGMRELLTHTLGAGITVAIDVQSALPDILADRGQLETVLLEPCYQRPRCHAVRRSADAVCGGA